MAIQIWQPGDKIKNDRFHILKQLGKGGFGITYLAEDTVKKQQIVIKTLNANQQGEADFAQKQENFVNEGFTLKTFNHPHIVKVYQPIQIGELWGLVMEYIPGQDLADYIIANGRLGEAEALNYIDQIAQALDCVHQQKFFHRDVKPHNIMLRQDRGEAVLIDFGIAKEFVDLETIYLSNSLGTELYKPIEQYEKRGQFGAYTDIYALAVTLYHLLTGAAPGGGSPLYTSKARKDAQDKGWGDKLDEHLWEKLAEIGISESTQAAIKAGMAIEPSQRPQNMTEFRKLLNTAHDDIPSAYEPESSALLIDEVWNELHQSDWSEIKNKNKTIKTKQDYQDYELAEAAYLQGNYEKAATIIDTLVSKFHDDPSVRLLRGHIYCFGLDQYEIGKKEYEYIIGISTDSEFLQFANSGLEYAVACLNHFGNHDNSEQLTDLDFNEVTLSSFADQPYPKPEDFLSEVRVVEKNNNLEIQANHLHENSQITLVQVNSNSAYAHWEIPPHLRHKMREQRGSRLTVLLYRGSYHMRTFDSSSIHIKIECSDSTWDLEILDLDGDYSYVAEIGYLTDNNQWEMLARSISIGINSQSLPLSVESKSASSELKKRLNTEKIVSKSNKMSPLIACIDDSILIYQSLEDIFIKHGYRCYGVQDPLKIISNLHRSKPDFILLDLIMPIMNGYEVCDQIRKTPSLKHIPVVILTAKDGAIERIRSKMAGANDFLSKPVKPKRKTS
jgi:serine/threonine protein kinase